MQQLCVIISSEISRGCNKSDSSVGPRSRFSNPLLFFVVNRLVAHSSPLKASMFTTATYFHLIQIISTLYSLYLISQPPLKSQRQGKQSIASNYISMLHPTVTVSFPSDSKAASAGKYFETSVVLNIEDFETI